MRLVTPPVASVAPPVTRPLQGMELEFLAERVGQCGPEECEVLLPELNQLFDAVLADCE